MTLSTAIAVPVVRIPGAWEADEMRRIPRTLRFRPRRVAALSGRARLGVLRLYSPGSPVRALLPNRVLDAAAVFYRRCLEDLPVAAGAREWLEGLGMGADVRERWRIGFAPPGGMALAEHLEKAGFAVRQAVDAGLVGPLSGDGGSWNGKEDILIDRPLFPVTDGDGGVLGFASDDPTLRHAYRPYNVKGHIEAMLALSDLDRGRDMDRWERDLDPSPRLRGLMVTGDPDAEGTGDGPPVWTGSALEAIAVAESGIGGIGAAPGGRKDPVAALRFLWRASPEPVLLFGGGGEERERARETLVSVLPMLGPERSLRIAFVDGERQTATFAREGGRPAAARAIGDAVDVAGALWELVIRDGTTNLVDRRGEAMRMAATVNDADMRRELWTALGERFGREYGSGRLISFPARPVAAPKGQDDPAARPIGDALSRGFAIQLACAITERASVDTGAHDIDLEIVLARVLARANADSEPFDDREREAAVGIAALRAEADLRARVTEGTGLPKGALYASRARILGYPGFADPDMERLWKGTVKSEMERLGQKAPPEPLPLDMLLARSARLHLDAAGRTAVDAATGAMGLGVTRDLDRILDSRERTGIFLSDETAVASADDRTLWRETRELYRSFTARHIRAMVLGTAGAGFGPEAMGRVAEGVARLHGPGPGWFDGPPVWSGLYSRHRDLATEMGNDRGVAITRAGLDRGGRSMATEMTDTRERKGDRTVPGEVTESLPDVFMRELRIRLSLVGEIGRRVAWDMDASEPSDGVMRGPCPFCRWKRAGKSTLIADDVMREWRCTECGRGGDVVDWIGMVEWITPLAGFREAAARAGIGMPKPDPRTPTGVVRRRDRIADANRVAAEYFRFRLRDDGGAGAREWLAAQTEVDGQSLGERDIDWWRIGYAPDTEDGLVDRLRRLGFPDGIILAAGLAEIDAGDGLLRDRFRDMVTFEIREGGERFIGFHAQSMESAERARHIATPDTEIFSRDRCLPNLDRADTRPGMEREILVGRSGLDMTRLQYLGGPAVASIDHGLTVGQMERLWRATECIVPVVPNLPEARAGAFRTLDLALPLLTGKRQMRFVPLTHRGSVSEVVRSVGRETAKDVLRVRCPLPDMLLLRERHGLDADRADHRARLYDRVRARLREIGDPETQYGFLRDLDHYAVRVERRLRERLKDTVAG